MEETYMEENKNTLTEIQEQHHSILEIISSIIFVVLSVIGMYFLSAYLNN